MSEDFSISVDTSEWERFAEQMEGAPDLLNERMTAAMDGSLDLLLEWITSETPVSFGVLRASFAKDIYGQVPNLYGRVVSPLAYGWPVELGRKAIPHPGKRAIDAIMLWVVRKGIASGKEARQVAWAIAKSPVAGVFMVKKAFDRAKGGKEIDQIWEYELAQFLQELAK